MTTEQQELHGTTALVTGSTSGIGEGDGNGSGPARGNRGHHRAGCRARRSSGEGDPG